MKCDFNRDLEFSLGKRERVDVETLRKAIPNCISVKKTDVNTDIKGIDYIAKLDHGAEIFIDAKARRKGAVKKGFEPCLALELWSVCKDAKHPIGKIGWTCSRETNVDMILYTFDKSEWDKFYLIPFQFLRMAFQHNYKVWKKQFKPRKQNNGAFESEAMFVPASIVLKAVSEQMTGTVN